jgi:hypothetical protein
MKQELKALFSITFLTRPSSPNPMVLVLKIHQYCLKSDLAKNSFPVEGYFDDIFLRLVNRVKAYLIRTSSPFMWRSSSLYDV